MSYNICTQMYDGYIYCIENLINCKKYIGYTKNDIQTRWEQHLSKTHHKEDNSILHLAIEKYGKDNFKIYPIRIVSEISLDKLIKKLKTLEKECIKTYNTTAPNGYNILSGGESVPINRITPLYQYTMDGEYIGSFNSITDAIQLNGFDDNSKNGKLSRCLRYDHCAFGYLWDKVINNNIKQLYIDYHKNKYGSKQVVQLDTNMNVIKIFKSVTEASKYTGLSYSNIYNVCSPKCTSNHTCGGFIWMFETDYNKTI